VKDHACAAPGCSIQVPGYLLACAVHWRQLPPPLQASINQAWARRRRRPWDENAVGAHLNIVLEAMAIWGGS
jgi:hypothetical protein